MQYNSLQKNNRIQWVRDLLSGEFVQGFGRLKRLTNDKATYCCLGVACERINPDEYAIGLVRQPPSGLMSREGYLDTDFAFDQLGLTYDDQVVAGKWNDIYDRSFATVADFVAYATENSLTLSELGVVKSSYDIPEGYAVEWLKQFD